MHGWPSGRNGRHAAFDCVKCSGFKIPYGRTLWDLQIVVLSLGVICVRFLYIFKVPYGTGSLFLMWKLSFFKKIGYNLVCQTFYGLGAREIVLFMFLYEHQKTVLHIFALIMIISI